MVVRNERFQCHKTSTNSRKLLPGELNVAAPEMPQKRKALWTTIAIQFNAIISTPKDEVSVENQWKTLKTVIKETV